MKKHIILFILIVGLGLTAKSQTVTRIEPWNVRANYLTALNLPVGNGTDSLIVKASDGWFKRIAQPVQNWAYNATSVGLSKATLNTTYPNVPIGFFVFCPAIALGGAVYVKATEAGSSDVWHNISAPPVL